MPSLTRYLARGWRRDQPVTTFGCRRYHRVRTPNPAHPRVARGRVPSSRERTNGTCRIGSVGSMLSARKRTTPEATDPRVDETSLLDDWLGLAGYLAEAIAAD